MLYTTCINLQDNSTISVYVLSLRDAVEKIGGVCVQTHSPPVFSPQEAEVVLPTAREGGSRDQGIAVIDLLRLSLRDILLPS